MAKTTKASKPEPPLAHLLEKDITPTMERYCEWLTEQTGYEVDPMSVQLAGSQRGLFQKSDFNQKALAEAKARREAEEEAREQKRAAKANKSEKSEKATTNKTGAKSTPAGKKEAPTTSRRRASSKGDF